LRFLIAVAGYVAQSSTLRVHSPIVAAGSSRIS
jgi:hypothetical protein